MFFIFRLSYSSYQVQPNEFSDQWLQRFKRRARSTAELIDGIEQGNTVLISQAITLVESQSERHQQQAEEILAYCLPKSGRSMRIGITGVPGVGKSTFIEALGQEILKHYTRVAVLAVDPSSAVSGGSILGDKTRMARLAADPRAFIRPSPTSGVLGGVAAATRETLAICEAAGFEVILVETVGVGQSETLVREMVDFFLLLLLPNAGDELQGIKRGIMEMADWILVNKSEGESRKRALLTQAQCNNALHFFPAKASSWTPKAALCSALQGDGVGDFWSVVEDFYAQMRASGYLQRLHKEQTEYWLQQSIEQRLRQLFFAHPQVAALLPQLRQSVVEGRRSPFRAADELVGRILGGGGL